MWQDDLENIIFFKLCYLSLFYLFSFFLSLVLSSISILVQFDCIFYPLLDCIFLIERLMFTPFKHFGTPLFNILPMVSSTTPLTLSTQDSQGFEQRERT